MFARKPCRWKPPPRFSAGWGTNHKGHEGTRSFEIAVRCGETSLLDFSYLTQVEPGNHHLEKQKGHKDQLRVPLCPLWLSLISGVLRVRHHLKILRGIPAAEMTGVVPAPVRAVARADAPRAAVAAQTVDALPQAACIDDPAADLPVANRAVAVD
jgi:hypothetical protein